MQSVKHKPKLKPHRLTTLKNVSLAIVLWLIFWLGSQYLFFGEWPTWLADATKNASPEQQFILVTAWILITAAIGIVLWHKLYKKYSFLKTNRLMALVYIIPLSLAAWWLFNPSQYGVSAPVYVAGIMLTTFWQDILTFGFLQTYLEDQVGGRLAACITATVFFIGHLGQGLALSIIILEIIGFIVFAYLRYRTKSIYATNLVHLTFVLLPA